MIKCPYPLPLVPSALEQLSNDKIFIRLDKHIQQVKTMLHRLLNHHLYVKAEKCEFHTTSMNFIGYHISSGLEIEDSKVWAITEWPAPTSVK